MSDLISKNAPAIEQGELVKKAVADALEEAALIAEKICFGRQTTDDAGSSRWLEAGKCGRQTADAIRALIKRNAEEGE